MYALINERQITLARLYRIANSANDIYMKILFYWHCLVYPNQKENDAINFLNDLHPQNIPRDMKLLPETLECILEDNHFKSKGKQLGNYIQKEIRHAIAHIKREKNEYTELELDNIQQIRHLNTILKVLKATARYRLLYLERIIDNTDISEYFHIQAN